MPSPLYYFPNSHALTQKLFRERHWGDSKKQLLLIVDNHLDNNLKILGDLSCSKSLLKNTLPPSLIKNSRISPSEIFSLNKIYNQPLNTH